MGDELSDSLNTVTHDNIAALGMLSNKVEGHLNHLTFGQVAEKDLAGDRKAKCKEGLSQRQSMISLETADL